MVGSSPTAVQVGILLAAVFFLKKMIGELRFTAQKPSAEEQLQFGQGVTKYVIAGPLFFGTAKRFEDEFPAWLQSEVLLLQMKQVSAIDATGEAALASLLDRAEAEGIRVIIKQMPVEQHTLLKRSGLYDKVGEANFYNA